jgi:hypothetical protein
MNARPGGVQASIGQDATGRQDVGSGWGVPLGRGCGECGLGMATRGQHSRVAQEREGEQEPRRPHAARGTPGTRRRVVQLRGGECDAIAGLSTGNQHLSVRQERGHMPCTRHGHALSPAPGTGGGVKELGLGGRADAPARRCRSKHLTASNEDLAVRQERRRVSPLPLGAHAARWPPAPAGRVVQFRRRPAGSLPIDDEDLGVWQECGCLPKADASHGPGRAPGARRGGQRQTCGQQGQRQGEHQARWPDAGVAS